MIEWLMSDAGAGWIVGILGLMLALISYLRRREQPSRVVIQEVSRTRLLDIRFIPRSENLRVLFTDHLGIEKNIGSLEQREFVLYNTGTTDILDAISVSLDLTHRIVGKGNRWYKKVTKMVVGKMTPLVNFLL